MENFDICWIEEAQTITKRSLMLLTPTIRAEGAEIWATWNPRLETDAIEVLLRGPDRAENATVVQANFRDNPFFPDDLRVDMERDKRMDESLYLHIWEGDYMLITEGAYYAKELGKLRLAGGVTSIPIERGPPISTAWDIGVDDATAIWVVQPAGREVRLVDYYEDRGFDAAHYARWVRDREYDSGMALLPHDAGHREKGTLKTYQDHLREAGIARSVVLPQTRDVMNDIQACRAFLSRCVFDDDRCRKGLLALGSYRVEFDETLQTPKRTPVHDWACHGADAFRALVMGANRITSDAIAASHTYGPDIRINIPGVRRAARRGSGGGSALGYSRGS